MILLKMREQSSVVFVDSEKDTKKYQAFTSMLFICYIIVLIIR